MDLIQKDDLHIVSTEYKEFLADGVPRYFRFNESNHFSENKYWIKDSVIYKGEMIKNEISGVAYKDEFFDKN